MTKALQVEPDIGLREILEISQSNRYSVQYTPFLKGPGGQLGGTIIRQASPLKGQTMREDETFSEYQDRLAERFPDIAEGLGQARQMAMNQQGTSGVAVIEQAGDLKIVSQAAANLAVEGQQGARVLAQNLQGYSEALDELAARGEQAHLPTIA